MDLTQTNVVRQEQTNENDQKELDQNAAKTELFWLSLQLKD